MLIQRYFLFKAQPGTKPAQVYDIHLNIGLVPVSYGSILIDRETVDAYSII
jgi:hypothetical protein